VQNTTDCCTAKAIRLRSRFFRSIEKIVEGSISQASSTARKQVLPVLQASSDPATMSALTRAVRVALAGSVGSLRASPVARASTQAVVRGTGGRIAVPPDVWKDSRKAAEYYQHEFENSSSSEEVVAAERGEDPFLGENAAAAARASNSASAATDKANAARQQMGKSPSAPARPRGGVSSIPAAGTR